jgi:DUF2911 family protein
MDFWPCLCGQLLRWWAVCGLVIGGLVLAATASTQQSAANGSAQAVCTFADGKQMYVRYDRAVARGLASGKLWAPGGSPMLLFTGTTLTVGGSQIPVGAYAMYAIPEKRDWTLVVNRDVSHGSRYDEGQDLVRVPMEVGSLDQATKHANIYFGYVAPKQCDMRIYYGAVGTWVQFREK